MPEFPNFYENLEEANFRLKDTVVAYDGKPAYVHHVRDGYDDGVYRVFISMLPAQGRDRGEGPDDDEADELPANGRILRKKANSPKFNKFRPFNLGFANLQCDGYTDAVFLSRIPVRASKQGLCRQSFHRENPIRKLPVPWNFENIIYMDGFVECVTGQYPTLEQVRDVLDLGASVAVNREFAVDRDNLGLDYLWYRKEKVGLMRRNELLLGGKYSYLREKIIATPCLPNNVGVL